MDINRLLAEYDSMFGRCQLAEIEAFLQQNIELADKNQEYGVIITLLNEIIGFYRDTTQKEKALGYCDALLQVLTQLKLQGRVEYATSLLNIANAYRAFGLCEKALDLYEQVQKNYQMNVKAGSFDYASLYNNWSLVYQELGEYEQARELLFKALRVVDLYEDAVIQQANTRTNLATTLLQFHTEDAYVEAMGYLREALAIYERDGGRDFHYGAALVAMGDAYVSKKEYQEAADYYQRGMKEIEKHVGKTENYTRVEEKYAYCMNNIVKCCIPIQEEGIQVSNLERCKTFYEKYGKPMIHKQFPEYEKRIAVGLVGEGSDCFGFDDAISADHDYGIGFCMWLTDEDYQAIGGELQKQYAQLIRQYGEGQGYHPFLNQRRGVFSINSFCEEILGMEYDYEQCGSTKNQSRIFFSDTTWLVFEESRLATFTNGEIFRDDCGVFTALRKQLMGYYPDKFWRMRLSQVVHEFSQYAQSNYPRMMARRDNLTANVCVAKAVESVMDIVHLLNRTYAPYYKWKRKSMERLPKLQQMIPLLEEVLQLPSQGMAWEQVQYDATRVNTKDELVNVFERIAGHILEELRKQELVEGNDTFLESYCQQITKGKNMDVIEQIVDLEWEQFDKVKNEGGRASCQDDFATFSVMRKSQYMTWNRDMLISYCNDLQEAERRGWNLIMEKYARMMKSTAPEEYAKLEGELPVLNDKRIAIQEEIIKIQVAWMEEFAGKYPKMADNARSIHTSEDSAYNTSYETYLRGELGIYSENTFVLYGRFITELMQNGKNLAYETMTNTAKLYGYETVEDAEKRMW